MEIVIGGAIFWMAVIGLIIALEFFTVYENHWGAIWIFGFLCCMAFFTTFNPFAWMWHNSGAVLVFAATYIMIGIGWGFGKWWFHLKNEMDRITPRLLSLKSDYANSMKIGSPGTFTDYLEGKGLISRAKNKKTQISVWMFWWPFSMFWTFFDDLLRRFYNWVIERYIDVFDKINTIVFGDLNK